MNKLELQKINKHYGKKKHALCDFSFEFTNGIYGLLGPNGAGKSTLMNIVTDNLLPDKDGGKILWNSEETKVLKDKFRSRMGFMPQQQNLYESMTARTFLNYIAALKCLDKKTAEKEIPEIVERVELSDSIDKKMGGFSGGMKQRALIAQALLNEPEILILDEPTAGLDPKERIRIRNFISDIAEDKIVILATHVVSDIEFIAKEVILLKSGKLVACDNIAELLKTVEDKTFEITTEDSSLVRKLQENYRVSNILREGNTVKVRIVTDNLPNSVQSSKVKPTLEDLYLYIFEEEKL